MAGIETRIEVKGIEELNKKLQPKTVKEPLADGIRKITLELDRTAKMATPVDTGFLGASITNEIAPEYGRIMIQTDYASFVELGTKKMEARHVEGSKRVYGLGMFGYAIQVISKKMGDFMKELGINIERKMD